MTPPPSMQLETVVSWLPDPRGWAMFGALTRRARGDLGGRAVLDARGSNFGGWVAPPQRFAGLAGLLGGRQRAIANPTSQLVNERSNLNAGAMGAFYEQLQRKQGA